MDIYEEKGNVIAEIGLPGVDPNDIDVEIENNVLKLEAKTEKEEEKKDKGYYRKELSQGYCRRAVPLPVEVIGEKAEASYKDGILKVVVPKIEKKEKKRSNKIKVKTEK
jgi:HSP20 family protein